MEITRKAIDALRLPQLTDDAIEASIENAETVDALDSCDESYFKAGEDIAGRLFAFIKTNKNAIPL
jgi:hypothetical protein